MSDCCVSPRTSSTRQDCESCGSEAANVSRKTLLHHLSYPGNGQLAESHYYYCSNQECATVYFSEDGKYRYTTQHLRELPWQKSNDKNDLICFCFGLSYQQIVTEPAAEAFIKEQTRQGLCECEARNVSGKCCLALIKSVKS